MRESGAEVKEPNCKPVAIQQNPEQAKSNPDALIALNGNRKELVLLVSSILNPDFELKIDFCVVFIRDVFVNVVCEKKFL